MTNPTNRMLDVVLAAMPGTVADIAERTGLYRGTVRRWINRLHVTGLDRQVFISGWERRTNRGPVPRFAKGARRDVPRPPDFTQAERQARWAANKRAAGEFELYLARRSARARAKNAKFTRDPLLALFYRHVPQGANHEQRA